MDKSFALFVKGDNVCLVFFERAERLRLVEIFVERNFTADFSYWQVNPSILGVWFHLAEEICVDVFIDRDFLAVAKVAVALIKNQVFAFGRGIKPIVGKVIGLYAVNIGE